MDNNYLIKYLRTVIYLLTVINAIILAQTKVISISEAELSLKNVVLKMGGVDSTLKYWIAPETFTYHKFLEVSEGKHSVPLDTTLPKKYVMDRLLYIGYARLKAPPSYLVGECVGYIDAYTGQVLYFFENNMKLPKQWKPNIK